MKSYFLKRLITLIPVCLLLIVFAFILTLAIPGDAIDEILRQDEGVSVSAHDYQLRKEKLAYELGLDKPVFYFSITSMAEKNVSRYFANPLEETAFKKLLCSNGNSEQVTMYFTNVDSSVYALIHLSQSKTAFNDKTRNAIATAQQIIRSLKTEGNPEQINEKITLLENLASKPETSLHDIAFLKRSFYDMQRNATEWKSYIPIISFNASNQFHDWFFGNANSKGIIRGDFGKSYLTGKPVTKIISEKILWSLALSAGSIFLAYLLSIPLAVFLVYKKSRFLNSTSESVMSFFYATPVYLMGLLLILVFSNPEMLDVFPSSGVKPTGGYLQGTTMLNKFLISMEHLALPLICYTYGTFAFLTRTLQSLLIQEMKSDYIRTARAKGMREFALVCHHALRNSLLPLVALFANLFPAIIGGSVILETMFTIPGMGFETFKAASNKDYPVIIAIFTFSGLITVTSYLISDFLTSRIDPRIAFDKN